MDFSSETRSSNDYPTWPRTPRHKYRWRYSKHAIGIDFSPLSIAERMESNLLAGWIRLSRWLGASVHDEQDLLWFFSGLPFHLANGVAAAALPPGELEEKLTQLTEPRVPRVWLVSPTTRWRAELEKSLLQRGWTVEAFAGVAIDLFSLDEHRNLPPELTIERVRNTETLQTWLQVMIRSSEGLAESLAFLQDAASKPHFENDSAIQYYLGFLDGKPVATSLLSLDIGVAGMYCVTALPEVRRRGIGSAMILAPLLDARTQGYRIGTLQAKPTALNFYQHLGFHEVCHFQAYFWPTKERKE